MSSFPPSVTARCSIARGLDVLGQKWSLLIIREAMWGRTRYSEFRTRLGIAPDVLSDRLAALVDNGILERRSYREEGERERDEYVLTEAGRDLRPVLAAINAWGDVHRPTEYGPAALYVDAESGSPVHLTFLTDDGHQVPVENVDVIPGPGSITN